MFNLTWLIMPFSLFTSFFQHEVLMEKQEENNHLLSRPWIDDDVNVVAFLLNDVGEISGQTNLGNGLWFVRAHHPRI